jgi:hypothetical protein
MLFEDCDVCGEDFTVEVNVDGGALMQSSGVEEQASDVFAVISTKLDAVTNKFNIYAY